MGPEEKKVLFILPTYGHFDYAKRAAETFLEYTPNGFVLLIDDGSPGFDHSYFPFSPKDFASIHFNEHAGDLTRSWNEGLWIAKASLDTYAICGNSDVLFTPHWFCGIERALEKYSLVGPLTNAPGHISEQNIRKYVPEEFSFDAPINFDSNAAWLRGHYSKSTIESPINGFCMVAKTSEWWSNPFSDNCVFNPSIKMAGNEDELQRRWQKLGKKSAIVLDSFVFHYRGITRGLKHHKDQAYRTDA